MRTEFRIAQGCAALIDPGGRFLAWRGMRVAGARTAQRAMDEYRAPSASCSHCGTVVPFVRASRPCPTCGALSAPALPDDYGFAEPFLRWIPRDAGPRYWAKGAAVILITGVVNAVLGTLFGRGWGAHVDLWVSLAVALVFALCGYGVYVNEALALRKSS